MTADSLPVSPEAIRQSQQRLKELAEKFPSGMPFDEYVKFHPMHVSSQSSGDTDPIGDVTYGVRDNERDIFNFYVSAPRVFEASPCIAWMRKTGRMDVEDDAVMAALCMASNDDYVASSALFKQMAERMNWPAAWADAAFKAEWKQAQAKADAVIEAAKKAARQQFFDRESATKIIESAVKCFRKADLHPPREFVVQLCKRVVAPKTGSGRVKVRG
jgi:hypothetical protein